MALILKHEPKESSYSEWYKKNRQRISEKRRKQYSENPEYRQRALVASKQYRDTGSSAQPVPSGRISFAQAAAEVGIGTATLREWRRKKLFPEPEYQNGRLWFSPHQVLLLSNLKEFFRKYGKRPGRYKQLKLQELIASVAAEWE